MQEAAAVTHAAQLLRLEVGTMLHLQRRNAPGLLVSVLVLCGTCCSKNIVAVEVHAVAWCVGLVDSHDELWWHVLIAGNSLLGGAVGGNVRKLIEVGHGTVDVVALLVVVADAVRL